MVGWWCSAEDLSKKRGSSVPHYKFVYSITLWCCNEAVCSHVREDAAFARPAQNNTKAITS